MPQSSQDQTSSRPGSGPALPPFRSDRAYSIEFSHYVVIQGLVVLMTSLALGTAAPLTAIAAWALVTFLVSIGEDQALRAAERHPDRRWRGRMLAPALRIATTTLYAVACWALIAQGTPGARLFAFALMAVSMVYVLLRYYRSPRLFLAGIAPYVFILGLITMSQGFKELTLGHTLGAVVTVFTPAIFALLFWSARRQLAASWFELLKAREAAEDRERAAEAANRAKSAFLTTMSHELRTPLNGVLGMAQALSHDGLTDAQVERVRIIRRSGESLMSVLNDLLDLSKIEASTLELEEAEFDLEHLIRGVAAAFRPEGRKKGLEFDFEITADAAGRYMGDAPRIKRILYNLAANAVKFTEAGHVLLSVDRQDGQVVIRFTDTGIGIAAEHLDHLFDDFFQVDGSFSRRQGGSGLGLAVCRELCGLMSGSIEVESELGKGSTFTVRLPLPHIEAAEAPVQEAAAISEPVELRVLAAEDNDTNRIVLKTLLAQAEIQPFFVVNGVEAVAAWERQDWDLILMDIQMPEMDGLEATKIIRRREVENGRRHTPIVALTANAMIHQVRDYEEAGMEAVVAKPIEITRLFSTIQRVLEGDAESSDGAETAAA